jgi:AbrB family looped-hinge helix DNA binding protein
MYSDYMPVRNVTSAEGKAALSRIGQRRQVVIPKAVFDSLGLEEGDFVEVVAEGRRVVMRPKRLVDLDDTLTPAEARKVRAGLAEVRAGKTKQWKQLKNELGV